jgi:CRP/FNR family transcriptional regulator
MTSHATERRSGLRVLDESTAEDVAKSGILRRYGRRDFVFLEGEEARDYCFVVHGRVKLVCSQASGRETILDIVEEGGLVCGNAVFAGCSYCCSAVADAEHTDVLRVPRARLTEVVRQTSDQVQQLLHSVTDRGMTLCKRIGEVTSGRIEQRIARLLLRLAQSLGEPTDAGIRIQVALSRQDVADLVGTSIETAIRVLKRMEQAGTVSTDRQHFVVHNRDTLEDLLEE